MSITATNSILKQSGFPYLDKFKQKFSVTDRTVFAYNGNIYSNYDLPPDMMVHELRHLEQQRLIGADEWVERYLDSSSFRLKEELDAYKKQIEFVKDRNAKHFLIREAAENLSSKLYGGDVGIISYALAYKLLK